LVAVRELTIKKGDVPPSVLDEPVVFKSSPLMMILVGCYPAFFVLFVIITFVSMSGSRFPGWAILLILTLLVGVNLGWLIRKFGGLEMVVAPERFQLKKYDEVLIDAAWDSIPVHIQLRTLNNAYALEAMDGTRYWTDTLRMFLQTGNSDGPLALRVLLSQVGQQERHLGLKKRDLETLLGEKWPYGVGMLVVGIPLIPYFRDQAEQSINSPSLSTFVKLVSFLPLAVITSMTFVGLFLSTGIAVALFKKNDASVKEKFPDFIDFIAEHQNGKIAAPELEEGVWYRYVDGGGVRTKSSMLILGILGLFWTISGTGISLAIWQDNGHPALGLWILLPCFLVMLVPCIIYISRGIWQNRLFDGKLRIVGKEYEISLPGQPIIPCLLTSNSKVTCSSSRQIGHVYWRFTSEVGAIYEVDPRFLVRDEP
jgi:hypothetical protein